MPRTENTLTTELIRLHARASQASAYTEELEKLVERIVLEPLLLESPEVFDFLIEVATRLNGFGHGMLTSLKELKPIEKAKGASN